jgi:hypothetical protein
LKQHERKRLLNGWQVFHGSRAVAPLKVRVVALFTRHLLVFSTVIRPRLR